MQYLKIENGKIIEGSKKDIGPNDYALEYNEITIIDKDRRKIRPLVADMLNKINIETLQTRLLKLLVTFSFVNMFIFLIVLFLSFSSSGKIKNINEQIEQIEKIEIKKEEKEEKQKTGSGAGLFNG